jgi:hypothetical protein
VCVRLRQDVSPVRCRQLSSAAAPYMEKQITKKKGGGVIGASLRGGAWHGLGRLLLRASFAAPRVAAPELGLVPLIAWVLRLLCYLWFAVL